MRRTNLFKKFTFVLALTTLTTSLLACGNKNTDVSNNTNTNSTTATTVSKENKTEVSTEVIKNNDGKVVGVKEVVKNDKGEVVKEETVAAKENEKGEIIVEKGDTPVVINPTTPTSSNTPTASSTPSTTPSTSTEVTPSTPNNTPTTTPSTPEVTPTNPTPTPAPTPEPTPEPVPTPTPVEPTPSVPTVNGLTAAETVLNYGINDWWFSSLEFANSSDYDYVPVSEALWYGDYHFKGVVNGHFDINLPTYEAYEDYLYNNSFMLKSNDSRIIKEAKITYVYKTDNGDFDFDNNPYGMNRENSFCIETVTGLYLECKVEWVPGGTTIKFTR